MIIGSLSRKPVRSPEHFHHLTRHLQKGLTTDRIVVNAYDAKYRHLGSRVLACRTSVFSVWMLPCILGFARSVAGCKRVSLIVCRPYEGKVPMPWAEDFRAVASLGRELTRAGLHFVDLMIRSRTGYWSAYESDWFSADCIDLLNSLDPSLSMSMTRTS